MNKKELVQRIVDKLGESLSLLEKAARASQAEATHESSKAESKYDTRGLEAAYLAGGQARQAREILESIEHYETLELPGYTPAQPIDVAALVELEADGVSSLFFVGPKNGGLEIEFEGKEITVITPHSPLGQNLVGKRAGQTWTASFGNVQTKYRVVSVR